MEKVTGKPVPDVKFFNMTRLHDRRPTRPRAAPRHGRPAGIRAVRTVGRRRSGEGGDRRSRPGVRPAAVRCPHVFEQHARIRLDSVADAGRSTRGEKMKAYRQWLPANTLRSDGVARRQLLLEQHRGLLPDAVGPGLRLGREVRSRLHRPRSAREDRREPAPQEGHAGAEQRRRHARHRDDVPAGRRTKYFEFPSAVYSTLPYDKVVKDGKVIGVSTWCGYSSNEGSMLTLAMIDVEHSEPGTPGDVRVGRRGRRFVEADRRAPRAARDPGDRRAGAVRRRRADRLPRGLIAIV